MESTIERVGEYTDRRGVLRRGGAAALTLAATMVGVRAAPGGAYGIHGSATHGCGLCRSAGSCSYTCAWCWWGSCHTNVGGSSHHQTQCCEGYSNFSGCTGGCTSALTCSFYGGQRPC